MKKLRLNLAQGAEEILTRDELKKIVGGTVYGSGTCGAYLPTAKGLGMGSLTYGDSVYGSGTYVNTQKDIAIWIGVSKDGALALTKGIPGAKWCCDSCQQTDWYVNPNKYIEFGS